MAMADNPIRQWLNVVDDTENEKALNTSHEQVLKGIPVIAAKSETRLFHLLPSEGYIWKLVKSIFRAMASQSSREACSSQKYDKLKHLQEEE
jgi:hypothetical protein